MPFGGLELVPGALRGTRDPTAAAEPGVQVSPKAKGQLRKPESFLPPQGIDWRVAAPQLSSSAIFSQFCGSSLGRGATCCLPHKPPSLLACLLSQKNSSWCYSCSPKILLVARGNTEEGSWGGNLILRGKDAVCFLPMPAGMLLVWSCRLKLKHER